MAGECLGSLKWLGILSPRHGQIHLMFSLVKRKLKDCNSDGRFWTLPVFINDVSFQIVFFWGRFTFLFYVYECLSAFMYMYCQHAWYPPRPEEGTGSLGIGVTDGCELPNVGYGT